MCDPLNHLGSIWLENIHEINKCGGGIFFWWRVEFFKISKHDFTFIREVRVPKDLLIKIRTRIVVKLLLFWFEFLWISLYQLFLFLFSVNWFTYFGIIHWTRHKCSICPHLTHVMHWKEKYNVDSFLLVTQKVTRILWREGSL